MILNTANPTYTEFSYTKHAMKQPLIKASPFTTYTLLFFQIIADCVQISGAQVFTTLINGIYIKDESLTKCNTQKASYRQVGGSSYIWAKGSNSWIGTTTLCSESNSVKQYFGFATNPASPADIPQDNFREINAARNAWLPDRTMVITPVACGKKTVV